MKTSLKHLLVATAALGLIGPASAQQAPEPATPISTSLTAAGASTMQDDRYGLLGEDYTGVRFGYVHHTAAPPRALHRYGFVSNRPLAPGLDTAFNYDYRTGGANGNDYWWHDTGITVAGYLASLGEVKPFLAGNAGWQWRNLGGVRSNGFAYTAGTGAEIRLARQLAVAPYVDYQEVPHFNEHAWTYGANGTYRFARDWSGLLGAELDEHHNLGYTLGMNRHF